MAPHKRGKHRSDPPPVHKDPRSKTSKFRSRSKEGFLSPSIVLAILIMVPVGITTFYGGYALYNYKRTTRLYTPLDAEPVVDRSKADPRRFWGTYRSNLYFGMR